MPNRFKFKIHGSRRAGWRIAGMVVMLVVAVLLLVAGKHWLSADYLSAHRDALLQFVAAHYWASLSVLGVATFVCVAASVPLSPALEILAGMTLGLWMGTVSMVIATALGSVLAMLVVRYLAQDFARARVRRHPKARRLLAKFGRNQGSYLLFLRFSPGVPLWLANILCGLTDIPVLRYSLLTLVGVIPDTFVFCNIGARLARLKSAHELLSPGIIVALALLAALALVPVAVQRLWRRHARSHRPASTHEKTG